VLLEENSNARILIVSDFLGPTEKAEGKVLSSHARNILLGAFLRAGISTEDIALCSIYGDMPYGNRVSNIPKEELQKGVEELKKLILNSQAINLLVPLGTLPLKVLTGLDSIHKQQLSILKSRIEYGGRKVIPLFHPREVLKSYTDSAYLSFGALKIKEEFSSPKISIPERKFLLNPTFEITLQFLDRCLDAEDISVDLETGRGQINTVGFSFSPTEAIAIQVLPDRLGAEKFFLLWNKIRQVCESQVPKVAQNALYEFLWLSRYGIRLNNIIHDTMWCQKFLHPELKAGLDNVGRLSTPFPYWKDDNESWNNIRDWNAHYLYNAKDTTGTHWAYGEQIKDLKAQGTYDLYYGFVQKFFGPITEMCSRGLLIHPERHKAFLEKAERELQNFEQRVNDIFDERFGDRININSPAQLKKALKKLGMILPLGKNSKGEMKETTDKKALVKLKKKHPKEDILDLLIKRSAKQKLISSYLRFGFDDDGRVRYSLNGCATETGRWNSTLDPFGKGFNAQTIPKYVRKLFIAEEGKVLIQVDLAQAESRYVAWEAPEPKLMELIQNGRDIHKYVASRIFNKAEETITHSERQLGKKSGHAANYGVGPRTFSEACLVENGIDISMSEARRIIESYFEIFPGIRRRQKNIRAQVTQHKAITTPLGRKRIFHDRISDGLFREAYAYCPQSTIPDITNYLMLYLWEDEEIEFLLQVHDSLLLQVRKDKVKDVIRKAQDLDAWHPKIELSGGTLRIPVDVEVGNCWGVLDAV